MRALAAACIRLFIAVSIIVSTCSLSGVFAAGTAGHPLLTGGLLGAGIGLVVGLIGIFRERMHERK